MAVRLVSAEWDFIQGEARIVASVADPNREATTAEAIRMAHSAKKAHRLEDGVIRDVELQAPSAITIALFNVRLRSRKDLTGHTIMAMQIRTDVSDAVIESDTVLVELGCYVPVLVRVEVANKSISGPPIEVGVALDDGSIECRLDSQCEAMLCLPPGQYTAYVVGRPVRVTFVVMKSDRVRRVSMSANQA